MSSRLIGDKLSDFETVVAKRLESLTEVEIEPKVRLAAFFHIMRAIRDNHNLLVLDLSQYLAAQQDKKNEAQLGATIANLLAKNQTLKELILDEATINNEFARGLAAGLEQTKISKISMQFCKFGSEADLFLILAAAAKNPNVHLNLIGSIEFGINLYGLGKYIQVMGERLTVDSISMELCQNPEAKELMSTLEAEYVACVQTWKQQNPKFSLSPKQQTENMDQPAVGITMSPKRPN